MNFRPTRRAGDMRSGTVNREPEIVRAMRLAFVPGRRAGSSRYGFRCSLGYASFGGGAFLVCGSCRNGRKRPFPGRFLDGFAGASPRVPVGIRRDAAPCRLGRRSGGDRLLRACRWAFRGPAVRFRFLWPAVVIRCGPDAVRYLFSLFVLSMYRFV